ncbi:MAG: glycerophosphodiester phosphodiesterase [Candidatus Roizmanbacteria bacterium]|nr:glycerophosphodiester phosphodiesterase [Candidatus Roizmanbacteria bacterium]
MLRILHGHQQLHLVNLPDFNGIELDLRMTRDRVVVISHDRRFTDGNARPLWIDRFNYADIERIADQQLPRFDEILVKIRTIVRKGKPFILELDIKQPHMEDAVYQTLKETKALTFFSEIIISSPRVGIIKDYSDTCKQFSLGLTDAPLDKWDLWDIKMFRYVALVLQYTLKPIVFRLIRRKTNREEIQIANIFHQLINMRLVEFLHERHIRVFAYGIRTQKQLNRLINFGVDGVKLKSM